MQAGARPWSPKDATMATNSSSSKVPAKRTLVPAALNCSPSTQLGRSGLASRAA